MTMERKLEAAESVLSKALTELREVKAERDRLLAINAQVAGENIKLRKALEEISTHGGALKHSDGTETVYTCDPALIARAALGEIK